MSSPPVYRALRLSDFGGDAEKALPVLIETFNLFQQEVIQCLSRGLSRGQNLEAGEKLELRFTSPSTGDAVVEVKHDLPTPVQHLSVDRLNTTASGNTGAPSDAWSCSWANTSPGYVNVTFQGLAASTTYVFSITYE